MITVEGEGGSITIQLRGYENPAADNDSDANWLSSRLSVSVGPFSGEFDAALTTQDLVALQQGLNTLLRDLKGKAAFRTDEDWLSFDIEMSATGAATLVGHATTRIGPRVRFDFSFQTDQSYLSRTKRALDAAVAAFPVLQR